MLNWQEVGKMNRFGLRIVLVFTLVFSTGFGAAHALDIDSVLQDHDPRSDPAAPPTISVAPPSSQARIAASGAAPLTIDGVLDVIEEITRLIEKLTGLLEGKTVADGSNSVDAGAKGGGGSHGAYTVQAGDTLWAIAQRFLGSGAKYWDLVEANKAKYPSLAKNPNLVYSGWVLTIPGASNGNLGNTGNNGGNGNPGGNAGDNAGGNSTRATGDVQQRVVAEAQKLVGKTNFPYAPATNGGRLGCAQVVSTALKSAGVLSIVKLGVSAVVSDLHARGWKDVNAPPFKAGDVICWRTYDRDGDGRKDPDTHIGIAMGSGNSVQAMSNSSSQRMPRLTSATYVPVTRVVRKA